MSRDLSVFTPSVVDLVFLRDQDRCAACGQMWDRYSLRGAPWGWDMQHRMARGKGGAKHNPAVGDVSNALIMCRSCHHAVEVVDRARGFDEGFAMSHIGVRQPWEVPVKHAVHGWCLLTRDGRWKPCEQP